MMPFLSTLAAHPIIPLFLFLNLAIGFWAHTKAKANSFEDYALASRSLPTGVLVMTLLATIVSVGSLRQAGTIYTYGTVETFNQMCIIMQFFLMGTFIAPCLVHFTSCKTLGDMVAVLYGRMAQLLSGLLSCIFCLFIMGTQLNAIGAISHSFLKIDPSTAIIGFGSMVMLYSAWGGIRAVSFTDVFQAIALLIVFSWITQAIIQKVGGIQVVIEGLPQDKATFFSNPNFVYLAKGSTVWALYPLFSLSPPITQRMLITQDKRALRKVWYANAFLYAFIASMSILIGLSAIAGMKQLKLSGNEGRELLLDLIPLLFEKKWIVDCIFLGFLAILFSTMDSYLHAMGISFVQDVLEPLSILFGRKSFTSREKTRYAKGSITVIGASTILLSLVGNDPFKTRGFYEYALLISVMLIVPLIIGIVGTKTDKTSLIAFCTVYLASIVGFNRWEWELRNYFYIAILFGILAYFATHIYLNGGIVTLKRSKQTIAEQLWIPTWQGAVGYVKSWLLAPLHLPTLASRKIVNNPTHSLSFSMVIFALYTFSSVMTGGGNDLGLANFMAGVHVVGITLCAGLMLEGIWPTRIKPYFALYWFFTLFYCLAFGSTLAFLRAHGDTIAVGKWIVNFIFLFALVDSTSFLILSCLGSGLAMASWYIVFGSLPVDLLGSIGLLGGYLLFSLLVAVILFERSKERDLKERFYLKSAFSHAMTHESTQPLSEISVLSTLQQRVVDELSPMQNAQGEKGFWVPASKQDMLQKGSQQIGKAVQEIKHEFGRFNKLIEDEISTLEREKVSMRSLIESIVPTLPKKHTNRIKVKVECTKDFEVSVVRPLFANVLANLLKNAYLHGNASEMHIHIEGGKRKLSIRDNGRGIKVEALPRIFELHFTTGGQASSGVGLALVKSIVQASGGKISCHSRHGDKESFTEFVMEFPEV